MDTLFREFARPRIGCAQTPRRHSRRSVVLRLNVETGLASVWLILRSPVDLTGNLPIHELCDRLIREWRVLRIVRCQSEDSERFNLYFESDPPDDRSYTITATSCQIKPLVEAESA